MISKCILFVARVIEHWLSKAVEQSVAHITSSHIHWLPRAGSIGCLHLQLPQPTFFLMVYVIYMAIYVELLEK
jgi:hypothetical protein